MGSLAQARATKKCIVAKALYDLVDGDANRMCALRDIVQRSALTRDDVVTALTALRQEGCIESALGGSSMLLRGGLERIEQMIDSLEQPPPAEEDGGEMGGIERDPRAVFVVHGRNGEARKATSELLRAVGLNPLEWEKAVELTGQPSPYIGDVIRCAFAKAQAIVVLLTGDDEARLRQSFRSKKDPGYESELTPQPRANVLFEAGMALGMFPDRTVLVEMGPLRPFSDVLGRHAVRVSEGSPTELKRLVQRVETAGCEVDMRGEDWLAVDFTQAIAAAGLDEPAVQEQETRPMEPLDNGRHLCPNCSTVNKPFFMSKLLPPFDSFGAFHCSRCDLYE